MNCKLHLVWPLCVAVFITDARSAPMNIIEVRDYEYTFEVAGGGFWGYYHQTDERWYTYKDPDTGSQGFSTPSLYLRDYKNTPNSLKGLTMDISIGWHYSENLEAWYGPGYDFAEEASPSG